MRNSSQRVKRIEALETTNDEKIVVIGEGTLTPAEIAAMRSKGTIVFELSPEDEKV